MAQSPPFKVYDEAGLYLASFKTVFHAVSFVGAVGNEGWEVRYLHAPRNLLWAEGMEELPASESYGRATVIAYDRYAELVSGGSS